MVVHAHLEGSADRFPVKIAIYQSENKADYAEIELASNRLEWLLSRMLSGASESRGYPQRRCFHGIPDGLIQRTC